MESSKRRFNIIDLILILVILLVVIAIAGKIAFPDFFRTKGVDTLLSCTLVTDSETSPYALAFKEGDVLYVNGNVVFGTVTSVSKEYKEPETEGASSIVYYELTVISELAKKDGAYRLSDGSIIVVGGELDVNSRDTSAVFKVTKTVVSEDEN